MSIVTNAAARPAYSPKGPILIELELTELEQLKSILAVYAEARPRNSRTDFGSSDLQLAIMLSNQLSLINNGLLGN